MRKLTASAVFLWFVFLCQLAYPVGAASNEELLPDWLEGAWKYSSRSGGGSYKFVVAERQKTGFFGSVEATFPQGTCTGSFEARYTFGNSSGEVIRIWLEVTLNGGRCAGMRAKYAGYIRDYRPDTFLWQATTPSGQIAESTFRRDRD